MEELIRNPLVWIAGGFAVLILGGKIPWPDILSWILGIFGKGNSAPDSSSESLENAVKHFIAIRDHCKDCPEAQKVLDDLWKCLPKAGGKE